MLDKFRIEVAEELGEEPAAFGIGSNLIRTHDIDSG